MVPYLHGFSRGKNVKEIMKMKHYLCNDFKHTWIYTFIVKCTKYKIICTLLCIGLGLCVDCFQVVFLRPIRAGFWKKPKGKNGHFTWSFARAFGCKLFIALCCSLRAPFTSLLLLLHSSLCILIFYVSFLVFCERKFMIVC